MAAASGEPATWSKDFKMVLCPRTRGVLGVGRCINTSVFSVGGHDWCVEYYPDGYSHANADWICLRLRLVSAHDAKAKFTFSLLDLYGAPVAAYTAASGVCAFSRSAPSWGFERFVMRRELELSRHLIYDDVGGSFSVRCCVTVVNPDSAVVLRLRLRLWQRNRILQAREVEEEEEEEEEDDVKVRVDRKMMVAHMSELVARCLVGDKIDLYGTKQE